jgi:L-arabinose isomerase
MTKHREEHDYRKPRIGLLFLTSGWFRDVGLQEEGSSLTAEVEETAREAVQRLSAFLDPVYGGVIYSVQKARSCARAIREADVDGLIVSCLMWCEDQILRAALGELPRLPMLIWVFLAHEQLPEFVPFTEALKGSGSVGALQISGMLKRDGYLYQSVTGHHGDQQVYEHMRLHCNAFLARRMLRGLRIGVLPFRCDQMSTTHVDEFALRALYGVELQYLELQRLRRLASQVAPREIERFQARMIREGQVTEVDERNLVEGIRYALAMEELIRGESLQVLAMNDVSEEMHACLGLRPCLSNPAIAALGAVVSMEADVAAGLAMYILRLSTGCSPFYTEPLSVDPAGNRLLLGHAGYHDVANRDPDFPVHIVPDPEYRRSDPFSGAVSFFKYRSGPVTAVNSVYNGSRLQWTVWEGESLGGPPCTEGNPHLLCRLGPSLEDFYTAALGAGVSQHWIIVPGWIAASLETLCHWLGIEFAHVPQRSNP